MSWSSKAIKKFQNIQRNILKKKILLNLIIENHSFWAKIYRWGHMGAALIAPTLVLIRTSTAESATMDILTVTFGAIAAGMIKLKEVLEFDKMRETSKEQTIRYSNLYDRIEREMFKSEANRQPVEEFLYWVSREYSQIEITDPEPSYDDNKKYIAMCKKEGIPHDDDLDLLQRLMRNDSPHEPPSEIRLAIDTGEPADESDDETRQPTQHAMLGAFADPAALIRSRSQSDQRELQKYQQSLNNINPKADLNWTMDRLKDLES